MDNDFCHYNTRSRNPYGYRAYSPPMNRSPYYANNPYHINPIVPQYTPTFIASKKLKTALEQEFINAFHKLTKYIEDMTDKSVKLEMRDVETYFNGIRQVIQKRNNELESYYDAQYDDETNALNLKLAERRKEINAVRIECGITNTSSFETI